MTIRRLVVLGAIVGGTGLATSAEAAKRPTRPPTALGSFTDGLQSFDASRWAKADGWKNGSPFDNAWLADHVSNHDGWLDLRLDAVASLGEPYSSGEVRSTGFYGYGCYEASFWPIAAPGVVTSFFTFAGPYDNGGNGKHNEIDIEFLGYDTSRVQLNFWTNDDSYASRSEVLVDLGFDAANAFHAYGFKWTSTSIAWYVDGALVHEALDRPDNPVPKAGESLHKIMVNAWPVDETAALWAGEFEDPGQPLHALYDWIRYTAGADCVITGVAEPPPPPPSGDATSMHVLEIAMSLDPRGTQAIARVSVVDGLGRPVAGAAVTGAWSGVITGGDTARTTDSAGVATFYSSRSRTPGNVGFCVSGITRTGLAYDGGANLETCESITK
ncbi:MAG: family 16 glycosylhydrolase [Steroidobacteraceae bacterium]